jgi:hypothetical protein
LKHFFFSCVLILNYYVDYNTIENEFNNMKGIYLTEEGKQEIEAKIAELETYQHTIDDIENCSDEDCFYIGERSGEILKLKEILSSATILPVEESWESMVEGDDDYEHYIENIVCFPSSYPNGVIIEPKK